MDKHIEKIQTALKLKIKNINISSSDNKVLSIPFEYYCGIQASISSGKFIFQNDFITPEEKEQIGLPRRDLGVDLTDKIEMIGQAKNWSQSIGLKDLGTFLQSQVAIKEDGTAFIKWTQMHLYRSSESSLSRNLDTRRFKDIIYHANIFKKYLIDLQSEDEKKEIDKKDEKNEKKNLIITESLQLLGESKNIVISVPIYEDDIIVEYLKKNRKQKCIIYVQNTISKKQYAKKLEKFKDTIKIEFIHSFKAEDCIGYDKFFFTDAHRIHPQHLFDSTVPLNDGYINTARLFIEKSNNCILLSHHIQEIPKCLYYRKSLRHCIDNGLCNSYEVLVTVFDVKPTLETIAEWVVKNLPNNCIVKTHNKKDGKEFVDYVNKLLPNSTVYFDCDDKSLDCLNLFKKGEIRFLCSPQLLDESFNAPICDSVLFLRPSDEQMYFTSVINRCLSLHPLKKQHSKIFFPSYKGDEKTISNMINILATYDDKLDRKKINNRESHIVNISIENEKLEIKLDDIDNSIKSEYIWKFDKIKTDDEHLEYVLEYEQKNEKLPDNYEWLENIKKDIIDDIEGGQRKTLKYKHILRKLCSCKKFILWLLEITNKTPNEEQLYCIISIVCNHKNMFIQGPGGTGKSYIIECIRQICNILFIQLIVLAPTGCASNAIKGETIHSFLKSPPSFITDEAICIVDEISMVGINKFKELCNKLSFIKKTEKLMGGLQVVYSGDFAQLQPVSSTNIVGSDQWKLIDSYKLLTINNRAKTEKLQCLLDKIRIGNIDKDVEEYLKSRTNIPFDQFNREKLTVLFYDNKSIKAYNEEKLSETLTKYKQHSLYTFKPIIRLSNNSNNKLVDLLSKNTQDEKDDPKSLFNPLKCCMYAKVLITKNIDKKNGAFNGAKGVIYGIDKESGEITILLDKNQHEIKVRPICLKRHYENGNIKDEEDMSFCSCEMPNFILGSCTICLKPLDYTKGDYYDILNYPFELGWATSIHKAQGQTIEDQLQIFLPQRRYESSLIYVAVSRITSSYNLYINASEILFDQIKPADKVKNIVEFGLECKKCKTFTHNKDNICESCNNFCKVCQSPLTDHIFLCNACNIVPFDPPMTFDDFFKKPSYYQAQVVKNFNKNTSEKCKTFIQTYTFIKESLKLDK
jgi:hypothetical protein